MMSRNTFPEPQPDCASYALHTPHSKLRTPHSTLQYILSTLQNAHSTLQNSHSTLHTSHSKLYTPDPKLQTPDCTWAHDRERILPPHRPGWLPGSSHGGHSCQTGCGCSCNGHFNYLLTLLRCCGKLLSTKKCLVTAVYCTVYCVNFTMYTKYIVQLKFYYFSCTVVPSKCPNFST